MSSQQFGPMRGMRPPSYPQSNGYSSGMIAAFVIVGIIVLAFLVLIILAVTLPAKYWGCAETNGNNGPPPMPPTPPQGMASPAAVVQTISGMGQVFGDKERYANAMRATAIGNASAHNLAPMAFYTQPTLTYSFMQNANTPVVANVLGAAQGALAGTVVAASGNIMGQPASAPPAGHSMLIESPATMVSRAPMLGEKSLHDLRNPMMGAIVQGLQADSLTIGSGATLPQVVSGAAHKAANMAQGAHMAQGSPSARSVQAHRLSKMPDEGFIVLVMMDCSHCTNLMKAVNNSMHKDKFVFMDHMTFDKTRFDRSKAPREHQAIYDAFMAAQGANMRGFPMTFYYHMTQDNINVCRHPVLGYSDRMGVEQLMKEAKNKCQ